MPRCDNKSVGVLIGNSAGQWLMFDRATFPPGVAGAAGHVDGHSGVIDAARAEVAEELGLTVARLSLVCAEWRRNRCRRIPGPLGVGHWWSVYRAEVSGELAPSARETRNVRWVAADELQVLTDRTAAYAAGRVSAVEFAAEPGIEPVWVAWLVAAGLVTATLEDLERIDRAARQPQATTRV
ncbi:NUDIX hydrolase [Streptosporangium sp. NPDC049078]|uniref:NUDIX hydrolase n=1 Tax=Streptosporangium sp. NPDC049078 TaxID=3155767 RepID=UPI00342A93A8